MDRQTAGILPVLGILIVYSFFSLYRLARADLATDEGRYGLVATNILTDYHQLAVLSEDPLGAPGSKPFMYALCLTPSLLIFKRTEFALRITSVLALLGAGSLIFSLVYSYFNDQLLALLTLFFFLVSPWTITYARTAMPETVMVFWGCLALFAAKKSSDSLSLPWALGSGLALGCSFLSKMWLCGPFVLACIAIFIGMLSAAPRRPVLKVGVVAFVGFACAAISHLLLVLWWTPRDLDHWLHIYFVQAFIGRAAGVGFDSTMWFRPWWFYCAGVFKTTFFGLPLILLGGYTLLRKGERIVIAVLAAMLLALPVLSLFRVKQTSFVYPIFPALAFMLAYGCVSAFRALPRNAFLAAIGISAPAVPLFYECGVLELKEAAAVIALYSLYAVATIAAEKFRLISMTSFAVVAMAALFAANILVVRISLDHRTYYREIANYFRAALTHTPPQKVAFVAPEFAALEFYLFRTGEYWQTYYFHESYDQFLGQLKRGELAFYIVDPDDRFYGGKVSARKLSALHEYATDETSAIELAIERQIPFQVFVPRAH
jgi:4-amino-4-deoxy-L-arabinose transferase-like glycosyltransferase